MTLHPVKAPAVGAQTKVAIVATSSAVTGTELGRLVEYFTGRGHPVRVDDGATLATGVVAGVRAATSPRTPGGVR